MYQSRSTKRIYILCIYMYIYIYIHVCLFINQVFFAVFFVNITKLVYIYIYRETNFRKTKIIQNNYIYIYIYINENNSYYGYTHKFKVFCLNLNEGIIFPWGLLNKPTNLTTTSTTIYIYFYYYCYYIYIYLNIYYYNCY